MLPLTLVLVIYQTYLLMQQFYQLTPDQRIHIALEAEQMRRRPRHQQTLINLRLLASLI